MVSIVWLTIHTSCTLLLKMELTLTKMVQCIIIVMYITSTASRLLPDGNGERNLLSESVSYLNDAVGSFSQIPVFLEFRSHFLRNRITPFTSVQLGYSIPFGSKNNVAEYTRIDEGGITFGLEVGARFAISRKLGLNIYVGYQMIQNRSVERGFNEVAASRFPELYDNLKFGIGVNF